MADRTAPKHAPGVIDRVKSAVRALGSSGSEPPPTLTEADVPGMLGTIAVTLLAASQATSDVQDTIEQLAAQYDRPDLHVFVLPTVVMIESHDEPPDHTFVFPANAPALRLDQSGAVEQVVRRAFQERQDPQTVVDALTRITVRPARFGPGALILGHTVLTVGFGLVLNPTATALPIYLLLGLVVGCIVLLGQRLTTLSLILPAAAAFIATLLVAVVAHAMVDDEAVRLIAPALVSFLPGLTLTIAAVELASGQVVAGASRLVYGVGRLALLTFGVYAGLSATGFTLSSGSSGTALGAWAPWLGLLLVGVGYYVYSGAPRGSLVWILYALVAAHASQLLGHLLLGTELSGLVGAAGAIFAVRATTRLRSAPSPTIMLTCAYWVLVPGSMGFIGMSEAASGTSGAVDALIQTAGSLIAIAIGMMLGTAVVRDAGALLKGWTSSTSRRRAAARGDVAKVRR